MIRALVYHFSPCVIAAIISLIGIIVGFAESSCGWSFLFLIILVPALFILIGVDWLVKTMTKGKILYIWIIEVVLIAIAIGILEFE